LAAPCLLRSTSLPPARPPQILEFEQLPGEGLGWGQVRAHKRPGRRAIPASCRVPWRTRLCSPTVVPWRARKGEAMPTGTALTCTALACRASAAGAHIVPTQHLRSGQVCPSGAPVQVSPLRQLRRALPRPKCPAAGAFHGMPLLRRGLEACLVCVRRAGSRLYPATEIRANYALRPQRVRSRSVLNEE